MANKLKLEILGSGTSTGVPYIGCNCRVCRSTDPHDKRLRASAFVQTGGVDILIDAGPDLRYQLLRADIRHIDALLVTHSHYDHVGGIDDLRPFCYPNGLDVYCQADVDHALRAHVPYCYAEHPYPGAPVLHDHIIKPLKPFTVKGVEVLPLPVNHYLMEIVGFRIGPLAYITDAKHIQPETIDAIRGVDTLVLNALREKEHISHLNLSEALNVISSVNPRSAYLTHMSHDIGLHAEVNFRLPENVKLAYDGLTLEC